MERDFDDKIKELYNQGQFEYNPANWDKLKVKLHLASNQVQTKKMMSLLGVFTFKKILAAASVLFIIGLSTAYYFNQNQTQNKINSSVSKNNDSLKLEEDISILDRTNDVMIEQNASSKKSFNQPNTSVSNINTVKNSRTKKLEQASSHKKNTNPSNQLLESQTQSIVQNLDEKDKKELSASSNDEVGNQELPIASKIEKDIKGLNQINPLLNIYGNHKDANKSLISNGLSVIGSYGKGLSHSVYAAGLNYQVGISKRFFIDGAVSVYGSNIQNVVSFSTQLEDKLFATTNSNGTLAVGLLDETNNNLRVQNANYAHLSVNPSFGYKISERLSIKAGLDMQKKVSSNRELSYAESNSEYKQLPNIDMGITPKIGIDLNKHWQTNLIYRKGINDLVYKKAYYNRSFVQIQLGYKF